MKSLFDTIRSLLPDFSKARRERRKIRQRYRKNLTAFKRDNGLIYVITTTDYSPEYLPNRIEKNQIRTDHLIQKKGSRATNAAYRISQDERSAVEEELENTIKQITIYNYISIVTEIAFIFLVVSALSFAVYLGIAGIGTAISDISTLY